MSDDKLTAEQQKQAMAMHYAAQSIGYNEMAKMAKRLEEKAFFRVGREEAAALARSFGSDISYVQDQAVGHISSGGLQVHFLESDIEAMREIVANWDAKKGAEQ